MNHRWYGLIELLVVLMFVVGWGVLELVTLRLDRRRSQAASEDTSRHPER